MQRVDGEVRCRGHDRERHAGSWVQVRVERRCCVRCAAARVSVPSTRDAPLPTPAPLVSAATSTSMTAGRPATEPRTARCWQIRSAFPTYVLGGCRACKATAAASQAFCVHRAARASLSLRVGCTSATSSLACTCLQAGPRARSVRGAHLVGRPLLPLPLTFAMCAAAAGGRNITDVPGSIGHYLQDAETVASWGTDYVKVRR